MLVFLRQPIQNKLANDQSQPFAKGGQNGSETIRLCDDTANQRGGGVLWSGVVTVMEMIDQTGSLSKAAKQMGMSYNKAWRILQRAEKNWGQPLVETNIGGASGGGTQLTAEGRKLVATYMGFRQEAEAVVAELFQKYFG